MPYKYSALTASGQLVTGKLDANDEVAAEETLGQKGYRVLTLKLFKTMSPLEKLMPSFFGIKTEQVMILSRQLATLLEAGVNIVTAMEIIMEQAPSGPLRRMLREMADRLREGSQLGAVLSRYPSVFPSTYLRMVEVGEQTGRLEEALRQAGAYIDKQRETAKKLSRALAYPSVVAGVAVVVIILLMVLVLPAMAGLFANLGAQLPLPTRVLMATASFLKNNLVAILLLVGAVITFLYYRGRRPAGRRQLDRLLLKLPLVGPILLYSEIARFTGTMATLLRAGVTVSASAEMGTGSCQNQVIKEALSGAAQELMQGRGLSGPLSQANLFPPMLVLMIRVGEETGSLDSTLATVAASYEAEVNERTQSLIALLEPALTVTVALVVGFIAVSVIMPIYSVLGSIK